MPPLTTAERTGYAETSTHADVMRFLDALGPHPALHRESFGTSPEGRDLPLLVLSSEGVRTPQEARRLGRPVVLLQNGIHAGEVEGKEAALMLVRDLLAGRGAELLEQLTLLVVPLFNPDGNDALSPENRALDLARLRGQDGPARVGTRVNALGINLNRDYIRQDAPEMRWMQTRICHPWKPDLTVDSHATNGSVHRFWMTTDIPHTVASGPAAPIEYMRRQLVPAVTEAVRRNHGIESGWYGNFVEDERVLDAEGVADPGSPVAEGWMTYPHHPRFGSNYRGLTGRLDLLLECYSYLGFEERTITTSAWLWETLRHVAAHADAVQQVLAQGLRPPDRVAVQYGLGAMPEPVTVLTRTPRTREGEPSEVRIPWIARFHGTCVVDRPAAYAVPRALAPFLRGHGLAVADAPAVAEADIATAEGVARAEGRSILEAGGSGLRQVSWRRGEVALGEGYVQVRTDVPEGALAVYLCEPESDDGIFENGLLPTPEAGLDYPIYRL